MARIADPDRRLLATLVSLVPLNGADILDVGCGDGQLTLDLAARSRSIVGIDPLGESIAAARSATPEHLRERVLFEVGDATTARFSAGRFDLVLFGLSL